MEYYFSTRLRMDFDTANARVTEELGKEGFGVVTKLDLQEKFREKLGKEFRKYTILGACNPGYAFKALQVEEKIGTMLPCNILVIDREDGSIEVAAVNPVASMMAIENKDLAGLADDITNRLKHVIAHL